MNYMTEKHMDKEDIDGRKIPKNAIFVPRDGSMEFKYPFEVLDTGTVKGGFWYKLKFNKLSPKIMVQKTYQLRG